LANANGRVFELESNITALSDERDQMRGEIANYKAAVTQQAIYNESITIQAQTNTHAVESILHGVERERNAARLERDSFAKQLRVKNGLTNPSI
jgi:hypothetical protein